MTTTGKPTIYCFGEVLWDILPHGALPGGAPFNVACHLSRLQQPCGMISSVGNDARGQQLRALMKTWGVDYQLLQTDTTHPTGEVLATMDQHHEMSYEIRFPSAWDFITATPEGLEKVGQAPYFVYGSLAARHATSRKALFQLLEAAPFRVLDINLRPPFFEKKCLEELLLRAQLLKTNQHELALLQQLFGRTKTGDNAARPEDDADCPGNNTSRQKDNVDQGSADPESAIPGSDGLERDATPEKDQAGRSREAAQVAFIRERFHIPEIVITKGAKGAAYYTPGGNWQAPGIPVRVADTVGSGDSFLAAFLTGHARKERPEDILRKATAMGAFIAAREGGCPEYQLAEYQDFCAEN